VLEDGTGFVRIGTRLTSDFWISWFSMTWSNVRSHGWSHDVSDVWMNRWVLKKLSKDTFNGLGDYVKDIKQNDTKTLPDDVVHYEVIKRKLNRRLIHECR
jgi:hypothetical protein